MWRVFSAPFFNAEKIFPTQQRDIKRIIEACEKDSNVLKIIIFGSSVTSACNPWSDIDAYFELQEDKPLSNLKGLEAPLDKWTNFMVDSRLKEEIDETGVIVYER